MHDHQNADALLQNVLVGTKRSGRLKIYLGMAAGVGKTYAMLSDALIDKLRGTDVVAGYIEPHGRKETETLTEKLESLPIRRVEYRGVVLNEFDLEAALKRQPTLILVDELAHTNAPSSRHLKRWQDIEELLASGIDVYTTVNVQHIESLKDVVAKITRVSVQETVPDAFLAKANDIELIDIPPEELIQRLKEGRVYPSERIDDAINNFFTKGNLIALRELVLRHTAERVDAQMHRYRTENAIHVLWPATVRVMVCVGPNTMASRIVRSAKRLASSYHAELLAVSIEGPRYAYVDEKKRDLVQQALELAKDLGAETIVRNAQDIVAEIMRIAHERNVSLIVVGKSVRPRWRDHFFRSLVDELIRHSGDVDVHVVTTFDDERTPVPHFPKEPASWCGIIYACCVTAVLTVICTLVYPFLELSNLIMIYLLGVAWVATKFGRWEAVTASVTGVLAFDFFFVPPHLTFAVSDAQYLVTFAVMLGIGLLISTLTLRVKAQAQLVNDRERRTASLYDLSKKLSASRTTSEIAEVVISNLSTIFHTDAAVILASSDGQLPDDGGSRSGFEKDPNEKAVIRWVFSNCHEAGAGTDTLPGSKGFYIPLRSQVGCLGVVAVHCQPRSLDLADHSLIEAFAVQVTTALDRIRNEEDVRRTTFVAEREKLRSSLLSSVSHDLRTPLASIMGSSSVLMEGNKLTDAERQELARTIHEESARLTNITRNVLDMTRLESESIRLNLDWCSLDELIGSALGRTNEVLNRRKVSVHISAFLPLVKVDAVLVEQLFINLFENVARHTPETTEVTVTGSVEEGGVKIQVQDNGPGFEKGEEERIFEKLYRVKGSLGIGFGLGLSICRAIMTVHGGSITAASHPTGGAEFVIYFPLGEPAPEVPNE